MTDNLSGDGALVLFSGGQDSATCLAWALDRFAHVETLGFDYGQRHRVELECRAAFRDRLCAGFPGWAARLGPDHTLRLDGGDFTIAAAPERCVTFADRNGGAAGFGLAAQIYSLRSPDDGGIGNFGGVAALGRAAAAQGADALVRCSNQGRS